MEDLRRNALREIPPVNEILASPKVQELLGRFPQEQVTKSIQKVLAALRQEILQSPDPAQALPQPERIAADVANAVMRDFSFQLCPLVNATGVVLHTNCGRSVLSKTAVKFIAEIAGGYSNLELELETGKRGSRNAHVEELICRLTGAEAALVVNNNAAAVLLLMNSLAKNREVIVSRGELVEVGGAFRIPEVLRAGGAKLVEVGATNKTRLSDYAAAVTDETALLLKVHTSNFRVVGFTHEVNSAELVSLGKSLGLPVVEDLGSGNLIDLTPWGIPHEPTVQEVIAAGVDLVTFSGDKLLGGPQAGVIAGKRQYVEQLKREQLTRALRIDKLTLAGLEATLRLYLEGREMEIPTLRLLTISREELSQRAIYLAELVRESAGPILRIEVEEGFSLVGGGSLPTASLVTSLVSIVPTNASVEKLEEFLRQNRPPVIGRIQKDKLILDVRTLMEGDMEVISRAMSRWASC